MKIRTTDRDELFTGLNPFRGMQLRTVENKFLRESFVEIGLDFRLERR
jgi:hypothetical protein